MRFVSTDAAPISCTQLRDALVATSHEYSVEVDDTAAGVAYAGAPIAHIELNMPGDGIFDEEREELIEFARAAVGDDAEKARVLSALETMTTIVAVQVLVGTGDTETTLVRLDPLWAWLFDNRSGLLHAGGEGYYDRRHLLLKVRS